MATSAFMLHWTWLEVTQVAVVLGVVAGLVATAFYFVTSKNSD